MRDETSLRRQMEAGARVKALLEGAELNDAFRKVKAAYRDAWERSRSGEADERERLWLAVQTVDRVRNHLIQVLKNGELAARQIREITAKRRIF